MLLMDARESLRRRLRALGFMSSPAGPAVWYVKVASSGRVGGGALLDAEEDRTLS